MQSRVELKEAAKSYLGNNIFAEPWLYAMVICLIGNLLMGAISFTVIGVLLLSGPLFYGIIKVLVNNAKGEGIKLEHMFDGFIDRLPDSLVAELLTCIFTFLWSLLLVIPGIIKYYSYSMTQYLLMVDKDDKKLDYMTAITKSREAMYGHKMELFIMDLSFIGWYIVGFITIIGWIWVIPYHQQSRANFYISLAEEKGIYSKVVSTQDGTK